VNLSHENTKKKAERTKGLLTGLLRNRVRLPREKEKRPRHKEKSWRFGKKEKKEHTQRRGKEGKERLRIPPSKTPPQEEGKREGAEEGRGSEGKLQQEIVGPIKKRGISAKQEEGKKKKLGAIMLFLAGNTSVIRK